MEYLVPVTEVVGKLCPAVIALYKLFKCVRHNKKQCQSLWESVKRIDGLLQKQKDYSNKQSDVVVEFNELAFKIEKYINKLENSPALKSLFHSINAKDRFEQFYRELETIVQALTLQAVISPKKSEEEEEEECIEKRCMKKRQEDFTADVIDSIMEVISSDIKGDMQEKLKTHLHKIFWKMDAFGRENHPINELKKIDLSFIERRKEERMANPQKNFKIYKGTFCAFPVLIKRFTAPEFNSNLEHNEKLAMKEARHLRQFDHPNIIRLYGIIMEKQEKDSFCGIVMEYCSKGSLSSLLQSSEVLSWNLRIQMAQEGASALFRLHSWSSPFVHKCVRSQSFLVNENNSLKLTDFEFARTFTSIQRKAVEDKHSTCLIYTAPENMDINEKCTVHSDIYSFGVVMWELATRKIPLAGKNDKEINQWISEGLKGDIPEDCPDELQNIINDAKDQQKLHRYEADEMYKKIIESFKEREMADMPVDCPKGFQDLIKQAQENKALDRPSAKDLVGELMDLLGSFDD
uniref:Protein kinase domain-containing protein n=2 Tax=Eptatretus burgeri TaxID=7764 RepID=A0A8C4Q107_EPTBU